MASPQSLSSRRRKVIAVIVGVFLAFGGLAVALPFAVRGAATSRIDRLAASMKGRVTHADIRIAGAGTLLIPDFLFVDDAGLEIAAHGIRIDVDPIAMLIGGRRITGVDVQSVDIRAGSRDEPLDIAGIAGKLASRLAGPAMSDGTAAAPSPAKTSAARRGTPLPDVSVRKVSGTVFTSLFSGKILEGSAALVPDPDTIDAFARKASFRLIIQSDGSDAAFTVEGQADMNSPRMFSRASATLSPSFTRTVRGVRVGVGGIEWKPGEIGLLSPTAVLPGSARFPAGMHADEVRVRWSMMKDGGRPASSLIPASMLKYVPESIKLLAGTVSVSEIRVKRPVVEISALPLKESSAASAGPAADRGELRERVTRMFSGLAGQIESLRNTLGGLAATYDGTRFSVTGATIRYIADPEKSDRAAQSYSNLDIQVDRGASGGLSARLRFECPESPSTLNEFDVDVLPDGTVDMALKAKNLKLAPYQVVLPAWLETDARTALTDTDVKIRLSTGPGMDISGRIGIGGATVYVPEVASEPMRNLNLAFSGSSSIIGPSGTLSIRDSVFSLGEIAIPFQFSGTSMNETPVFSLSGRIERVSGESLLASIPREAIPVLAGARLGGTFAATIKLDVNTADLSKLVFDFVPDMADLVTIDLGPAVNLELLRSTFLHRIEDRDHVVTRTIGVGSPGWVPYQDVPPYLIKALTVSEDARFFQHQGFSQAGIRRSLKVNLERGGFFQGASTLSQQLVKNLFLSREKTLARKLQEAFITWQVERNLPKEKILELYLNVIEWGPEVWGLKEAANHYFARDPSQLSVLESVFLVLIIPNPSKYHEFLEQGRVPPWFMTKVRTLVETLRTTGAISDLEALGTLQQTVRFPVDTNPENAVPDSEFAD